MNPLVRLPRSFDEVMQPKINLHKYGPPIYHDYKHVHHYHHQNAPQSYNSYIPLGPAQHQYQHESVKPTYNQYQNAPFVPNHYQSQYNAPHKHLHIHFPVDEKYDFKKNPTKVYRERDGEMIGSTREAQYDEPEPSYELEQSYEKEQSYEPYQSYQEYAAPVSCGSNLLGGCQPYVQYVPCSDYSHYEYVEPHKPEKIEYYLADVHSAAGPPYKSELSLEDDKLESPQDLNQWNNQVQANKELNRPINETTTTEKQIEPTVVSVHLTNTESTTIASEKTSATRVTTIAPEQSSKISDKAIESFQLEKTTPNELVGDTVERTTIKPISATKSPEELELERLINEELKRKMIKFRIEAKEKIMKASERARNGASDESNEAIIGNKQDLSKSLNLV